MESNGKAKKGFMMGVNKFTDLEEHEIGKGFRREMHPAWLDQLMIDAEEVAMATERKLGQTSSKYSVSCINSSLIQASFIHKL